MDHLVESGHIELPGNRDLTSFVRRLAKHANDNRLLTSQAAPECFMDHEKFGERFYYELCLRDSDQKDYLLRLSESKKASIDQLKWLAWSLLAPPYLVDWLVAKSEGKKVKWPVESALSNRELFGVEVEGPATEGDRQEGACDPQEGKDVDGTVLRLEAR